MKKLLLLFLFPLYAWGQISDANLKSTQIDPKIRNITTASGITKGNVSDVLQSMVNSKVSRIEANSTSGTNIYTATISWLTGYSFGLNFPVVFTTGNTAAATLNINTLGAVSLKKNGSTALVSGDIQNGQVFWVFYDGINFQLIGGGTSSGGGGGGGTVTSVTSADANATITNTTTTPNITIVSAPKWLNARTLSITGDLAYTSPSIDGTGNVTAAGTLATVNPNVGAFGSATQSNTVTVNAKGLITAITSQTVMPAIGSVTGLGTNVATALSNNTNSANGILVRDANSNTSINNINEAFATQATSAGTVTLTVASNPLQQFTGSTSGQIVKLPSASTLVTGFQFSIFNRSSQTIAVQDGSAGTLQTMAAGSQATFTCTNTGSTAGSWDIAYTIAGAAGTVTSVGQTFTGGIIGVSGSPITTSGTLALTVTGSSGGIPYFSSNSAWASSAVLAAGAIVTGGGAGLSPGTTSTAAGILTWIGTPSSANLSTAMTDESGSNFLLFSDNNTQSNPTITTNSMGGNVENGTSTATANNQAYSTFSPTITSRATASDNISNLNLAGSILAGSTSITGAPLMVSTAFKTNSGISTGVSTGLQNGISVYNSKTVAGMTASTYTSIAPASTSGSGTGALFTVIVASATNFTSFNCTTSGSGYNVGETVTFNGSQFGSGSGSIVLTILSTTNSFGSNAASLILVSPYSVEQSGMTVPHLTFLQSDKATPLFTASTTFSGTVGTVNPTLSFKDATGTTFLTATSGSTVIRAFNFQAINTTNSGSFITGTTTFSAGFQFNTTTPAQITSNQNDYVIPATSYFRLSTDASRTITGFTGGQSGKIIIVYNSGSNDIVLSNQDAGSLAADRFAFSTAANITVSAGHTINLIYDSTLGRWVDIGVR